MMLRDAPDGEPTAAEYVLGLLEPADDQAVERQIRTQPVLRQEAVVWSRVVADSLLTQTTARQPPGWVWTRIERQIPSEASTGSIRAEQRWRLVAAFVAILGLSALVAVFVPNESPMHPAHQAMLSLAKNEAPTWQVMANFQDRQLEIKALRDCAPMPGKKPVLWLAAPDGRVVAVGTLPMDAGDTMRVNPVLWHGGMGHMALAISLEPANAPVGNKPAGPVVWSGGWQSMSS
ncbi:anti-sigma factor domain-containing protein [Halothiobacillus sp. DCM-1]|uniref:anti-sigma factor n=1 Tax=Halothiobacillus sp. DCM-1 TaxID=3112558 RepID=UPI00324BA806